MVEKDGSEMAFDPKADWTNGWLYPKIRKTWDAKIDSSWWLKDPSCKMIADFVVDVGAKSVLDIGCGGGVQLAALKKWAPGITYTGVDIHPGMIAYCKQRWPDSTFYIGDARHLLHLKDFDVAIIRHVIEHHPAEDAISVIREALRVSHLGIQLLLFKPTLKGKDGYKLNRRKFYVNEYGEKWLQRNIEEGLRGRKAMIGWVSIPKGKGNPARNDQELWYVRYR